jgi:thiol peroxidase
MGKVALKGSPVTTSGELPLIGSKAPDFKLVDVHLKERRLSEFKGKRKLLYSVPSLDTETCSLSTKKFNDTAKQHPEIQILVVSADLPFAQKRFCGAEGVSNLITLSMMRSKDFAQDYGILILDGPLAGISARALVVLDANDKVLYTELISEITQEPNYEKALQALLSL